MKHAIALLALLSLPAVAGTGKEVVAEPAPSPSSWFAGGSAGYLLDFDEPMYHLHLGQDTSYQLGGWDFAWFLEIGYTEKDNNGSGSSLPLISAGDSFDVDGLDAAIAGTGGSYDLSVMPITINGKFETEIAQDWKVYAGAGIGFANIDLDINPNVASDNDWVFCAQVFAGVQYDINESWEAYSGARWMYFDEADIGSVTLDLDDDILLELGVRYNF